MGIIAHKKLFILVGTVVMLASAGVISVFGLNLGIDFTGGALTEVSYDERPSRDVVHTALEPLALGGYSLRETVDEAGRDGYILRTRDLAEIERQDVHEAVSTVGDGGTIARFTSIGPVIGQELRDKAVWAICGIAVVILLYVAFAFMRVRTPVGSWVYGGITIVALVHDVIVPTAVMSVLGVLAGVEVDVLFVMAILAVLGYSVNDTIVVFDRVRENLVKYRTEHVRKEKDEFGMPKEVVDYTFNKPFDEVVGESVSQTILRSINTSITTFLALVALYIFGGDVTETFALILMVGVIAGAYSSIFLASPLLVAYEEWKRKKRS